MKLEKRRRRKKKEDSAVLSVDTYWSLWAMFSSTGALDGSVSCLNNKSVSVSVWNHCEVVKVRRDEGMSDEGMMG